MIKSILAIGLFLVGFLTFYYWKVDPAIDFLETLEDTQRSKVMFPMDYEAREQWHFVPTDSYPRDGLAFYEMNEEQKTALHRLLKSYLSKSGYEKTQRIIGLESVLAVLENNPERRDPEKYFVSFYGNPEEDEVWAWSFEGHHVSLHFTIVDGKIAMTPRFFGANPARIPSGAREGERTLDVEEDLGFELINSMDPALKAKAIFSPHNFNDIFTLNDSKVDPLDKVGVTLQEMNQDQQDLVWSIINEYLSAMPKDLARKRERNLMKEEADALYFGWAGATQLGEAHYYRIQGKTFLLEFDNSQNNANHIHTIWRDFDGDFGRDLLREHYQNSNHHDH